MIFLVDEINKSKSPAWKAKVSNDAPPSTLLFPDKNHFSEVGILKSTSQRQKEEIPKSSLLR